MEDLIKCIIIDDEAPARKIIKSLLQNIKSIEVVGECSNGFEGAKAIHMHKPELVFLDIQMPRLNGFEMLEVLDYMPVIIFCTAYDEFAIKAFELNAADYLLKPFNKERFNQAVEKALNTINKQNGGNNENQVLHHVKEQEEHLDRVVIKKNDEILIIPAEDIDYITSEDDYIMIHTHKGKYLKNSTMNYMEKHLPISRFLRIHRTSIINLDRISKMEKYDKETYLIHLSMGQKFKCSKQGTKKLRARFNI